MLEGFLVISFVIFLIGMIFLIQGAPYVASDDDSIDQMIKLIKKYSPDHILDMGSGNGKVVIALAKQGYLVDGVELNPLLVLRSRRAIRKAGLSGKAKVKWGNFWSFNTQGYDLITLYAIKHIMPKLETKLKNELKPGSTVVSNYFIFPNLKPTKMLSRARVYEV
jgi:protein-L-isoaspartate O-methyltransferase